MTEFKGICLNNDMYVCKSLNEFSKFEFTLNWDDNDYMGDECFYWQQMCLISWVCFGDMQAL